MEVKCPHCGKIHKYEESQYRPFCSKRCQLIDLGEWADEKFSVPSQDGDIAVDLMDDQENEEENN